MAKTSKILSFVFWPVFFLALFSLSYFRVFDELEYKTLDFRYQIRPKLKVNNKIAIIHISDDTIKGLGEWPIPRKYHALLIKALKAAGAKDIVFDVFFTETTNDDQELINAAKEAGNVYMAYVFELDVAKNSNKYISAKGEIAPLLEYFKTACKDIGYVNVQPDIDGKVRSVLPFVEYKGKFYPHLGLKVALDNYGVKFENVKIIPGSKIVVDKKLTIPLGERSEVLINYPSKWAESFRHYSCIDVIQSYLSGMIGKPPAIDLNELKDSVCFIGFTAAASPDAHPSPLEPLYPGVGVYAAMYNSTMNDLFLHRMNRIDNLIVLFIISIITLVVTVKSRRNFAFLSVIFFVAGYAVFGIGMFFFARTWVDMFYPIGAVVFLYMFFTFRKYLMEMRRRELLEKELNIAKDIQMSFLPAELPAVAGIDAFGAMMTARQVGGDLYDVILHENGKLGVMIGDVMGKGFPASLFMAMAASSFKFFALPE
ncbi:MAG: CHASE2 domain-containing protein, partial [Candidatus Omnitrophica bacterium]|nr:CHASE2 domain-containing protein [Candidatus Omnitrophota bacterium]